MGADMRKKRCARDNNDGHGAGRGIRVNHTRSSCPGEGSLAAGFACWGDWGVTWRGVARAATDGPAPVPGLPCGVYAASFRVRVAQRVAPPLLSLPRPYQCLRNGLLGLAQRILGGRAHACGARSGRAARGRCMCVRFRRPTCMISPTVHEVGAREHVDGTAVWGRRDAGGVSGGGRCSAGAACGCDEACCSHALLPHTPALPAA